MSITEQAGDLITQAADMRESLRAHLRAAYENGATTPSALAVAAREWLAGQQGLPDFGTLERDPHDPTKMLWTPPPGMFMPADEEGMGE